MRLALLLSLLLAAPLFAEDEAEDPAFTAANKLFAEKKYAEALVQYKKLIEKEPKSPGVLYNAGTAAHMNKEYKLAIEYFKAVKAIDAADHQARAKLIQAFQAAGDTAARDAERAELLKMRKESKDLDWSQKKFYCRDQFTAGEKEIMVFEYFALEGARAKRYSFRVLNTEGEPYYSLGSYDATNKMMQAAGALKKDEHMYHLDGYFRNEKDHATYDFFTGEPAYDEIKKMVIEILEGKRKPQSSSRGGQ